MQITMDTRRVKPMVVMDVQKMAENSFEPKQIYYLRLQYKNIFVGRS